MKVLNIILLCLFTFSFVQAQDLEQPGDDLIILNNGNEFIGTIIEYEHDSYVVIKSYSGSTFRFEAADVKQIKQGYLVARPRTQQPFKLNKFYYSAGLGTIVSSNENFGLHGNLGVIRQFNQWLGLGLGLSYTDYGEYYEKMERMAIYVSSRSYYRDDFVTPYTELNIGYGIVMDHFQEFETAFNNGYYVNPKFGLRFGTSGVMWTMHIGASIQQTSSDLIEDTWGSWQQDRLLKRTELGFGIIF